MIRICFCLLWLFLCLTSGCNVGQSSSSAAGGEKAPSADSIRYAAGYTITAYDGYTKVEVRDPWNEGRLLQRYLLIPRDAQQPDGLPQGTIVRVPVKNMVVYTSVHCAILDELGASDRIAGVCESRYIDVPAVRDGLQGGTIIDLGEATSPNIEKMVEIGTEVVLASPFQNGSYGPVEKIGIPIVECADYMEADPLGRAEWLKFLGLLTGRAARADSLFRETETNYLRIKSLAEDVTHRPTLLTGMKFGTPWHVPAGESYMAHIFRDAGADYIFRDLPGTGSSPLAFETVLDRAIHADFWLIHYNKPTAMTYADLQSEYSPYSRFDAFRERRIYGCNTNSSLYYEQVPMHPDYLLAELIAIFHPDRMPGYRFRYFAPLDE